MATQQLVTGNEVSYGAAADLSGKPFRYVKLASASGQVALCGAADIPVGVLQNRPRSGDTAAVITLSGAVAKAVSDGSQTAIAIGDTVGSDANGKAVKKTAAGSWYNGVALEASSQDGKVIRIQLTGPQQRS